MRLHTLLLIPLLLTGTVAMSQIVNIETKRMQSDTVGWMGSVNGNVALSQYQEQVFSADVSAHLQYKNQKNLYLILGNYGFLKGAGQNLINSAFGHFRYNRKLNKVIRWEAFTQLQNNKITRIDSRFLAGTGPRFKIWGHPSFQLYAASLAMYEYEKEITSPVVYHRNLRSSSYLSFTWLPAPSVEITSTTFYQPLFRAIADFRLLNQVAVSAKATNHVSLTVTWSYLFDNNPVAGTPRTNYSLSTGLKYDFNP